MSTYLLHKATIVTAAKEAVGSVVISAGKIADVFYADEEGYDYKVFTATRKYPDIETIGLEGRYLMAGGIDGHVHFRDPGLTHKADMETESRAAAAGGVTTAFDMPNTRPATITEEAFLEKLTLAGEKSCINLGFHFGATNDNIEDIERILQGKTRIAPEDVKGIKVFMGSSTGNMLVDENSTLDRLFSIKGKPVLVHCEDEETIRANLMAAREQYGEDIPFREHEKIRSRKACIKSSIKALEMAMNHNTRLILCHISTKEEVEMARAAKTNNPQIIAETSCNYLWFCNEEYDRMGSRLKCNPSVKSRSDRDALRRALAEGNIDIIGSDHAPHLPSEKEGCYTQAPSGLPSIQQSLPVLLTIAAQEEIPLTRIAAVFSENASELYGLETGKVKSGYSADLVVFDKDKEFTVRNEDQFSKCGWSPYEGETLKGSIETVFVGGKIIYKDGSFV
ncbi:MAG: dihydroorotase [Bacteroidales bacterium]|nr:dihydroorotase [Bacteroidales bacterium]